MSNDNIITIARPKGAWYQCGECGAVFSNMDDCSDHKENCGGGGNNPDPGDLDDKYTCGRCGQIFSSSTALGAHAIGCN